MSKSLLKFHYAFPGGQEAYITELIPIGRMGRKEEIAHLLLYLVSDLGGLISGATIPADGASWMVGPNSVKEVAQRMMGGKSKM